jgi:hypothetical protein
MNLGIFCRKKAQKAQNNYNPHSKGVHPLDESCT